MTKLPKTLDQPEDGEQSGETYQQFVRYIKDQLQPELDEKAKKEKLLVHKPAFKASAAFCRVLLAVMACTEAQVKCHCFDDLSFTVRKQVAYDLMTVLRAFPTARTCDWWHEAWPQDFMAWYGKQDGLEDKIDHIEVASKEEAPLRVIKENFIERR